jgi:hypothetical protein
MGLENVTRRTAVLPKTGQSGGDRLRLTLLNSLSVRRYRFRAGRDGTAFVRGESPSASPCLCVG